MVNIKNIHVCDKNILFVDTDNKLWIMGNNQYKKTGFGVKDTPIYSPILTNITFGTDVEIRKFYVGKRIIVIYTSDKKLYVSDSEGYTKKTETNTTLPLATAMSPTNDLVNLTNITRAEVERQLATLRSNSQSGEIVMETDDETGSDSDDGSDSGSDVSSTWDTEDENDFDSDVSEIITLKICEKCNVISKDKTVLVILIVLIMRIFYASDLIQLQVLVLLILIQI